MTGLESIGRRYPMKGHEYIAPLSVWMHTANYSSTCHCLIPSFMKVGVPDTKNLARYLAREFFQEVTFLVWKRKIY